MQLALIEHPGELSVLRDEFGDATGTRIFLSIFTDGFESGSALTSNYETIRKSINSGTADFPLGQWFALSIDEHFMDSCSDGTRSLIDDINVIIINELIINLSLGVWDDTDIIY